MIKRKASAAWHGGLKDGKGTISTESGAHAQTPYNFSKRFESEAGTNPEELVGAAHASCFSMFLSAKLGEAGMKPEHIHTEATVSLETGEGGPTVTAVHLDVTARVPGADRAAFDKAIQDSKVGCPISKLLKATITVNAKLEEGATAR